MVISLLGATDKRPVIYTLMKLFQTLGDTMLVTNDRHLKRLIDEEGNPGHFQNILIYVTDSSPDEVFAELGYDHNSFEFIIYDCTEIVPDYTDMLIYVGSSGKISEDEETLLSMFPEYKTINLGFGEKCIPYTVDMFKHVELTEGLKHLGPCNPQIAQRLATFLTEPLKIPVKTILKVVTGK